jgi:sensor domain CHASE-containing protein
MSLRVKVVSLILFSFLVYGILDYGVQRIFILPSFISLEQDESLKNMDRAVQTVQREIQHLGSSATDWSFWDDTYQFAQDRNDAYRKSNLNEQALNGLKVNILYIFDADQQQIWGMAYDLDSQQEISISGLSEQLGNIRLMDPQSKVEGVLITARGPVMVSATPILKSDSQGPVMGYFVLGRFLNTNSISEQVRIELRATVLGANVMAPETNAILAQIHDIHETLVLSDGDFNRVYRVLPGLDEKPALLLQVDDPRLISAKGEKAVRFALLSILGASLVILIVLIIGLQRMVLIPLKRLTDHTVAIGKSNDLSVNLTLNRKDEIGILSREYDHMVERLATTQKVLMEQSYHSGMAEVAIGVLHNVGNVLNSVNVSCTLIMDQLRESSIGDVSEVAGLMNRPDGDLCHFLKEDSRGQMIPIFIASLATVLEEERQAMLRETKALHGRIEHIKEIVVMQQNYGQISTVSESILPEQLMEGSVKLNADELAQHNVTVQREYQAVPSITVNKHKVLQILINLINNAKNACTDCGCKEKNITLRIFSSTPDSVKMQVADNGIGITRENLTQIFQYGFTTRKSGRGFGLHSSALTAKELGCSLTANSDGPGFGATFTLELPCHPGDNK